MSNFTQVAKAEIPRSSFDRSHGVKTTLDAGWLYPIFVDEALPGDTFNLKMDAVARLATPLFPVMDNVYLDTFFFSVPYRLVWDNWEKFNGQQTNPNDSTDYVIPQVDVVFVPETIGDYMGLPYSPASYRASALPFRAYNLIYNEWFRDQNLISSLTVNKGDAAEPIANFSLKRRGRRHDYFTSALPWPQKGDAVEIPLGGSAPILPTNTTAGPTFKLATGESMGRLQQDTATNDATFETNTAQGTARWLDPALYADLSAATAATINSLRQAFQVQKILERDARGGTRYTEIIKAHFGVTSPDARLQRPEYLGGYSTPININEVVNTTYTETSYPLGTLAGVGRGLLSGSNNGFTASFTEHCVIIGLVSARAEQTLAQRGLDRMWSRKTRFDFYWPALAMIGEQAVLNKEIWTNGDTADDDVFGYQERYAEYRYKPSKITGEMRSDFAQSLDGWHLAMDYTTRPTLGATFIGENPPMTRVLAAGNSAPNFILDAWFTLTCARPMPTFGIPGLIDHF